MISLKRMLLFFGLISTLFSGGTEGEFLKKKNKEDLLLHYLEPGKTTDQIAEDCDKQTCKEKICNCCPGYGVRAGNFMSRDTCRRCNCGQLFSCSYTNWDTKTCYCDIGFTDVSGTCIADCKENPCENGGTCTVENNKVFCVCREPYAGKLCDKIKSTTDGITKPEDTTTKTSTKETTDLVTVDDISTTTENFENVTLNETLTTTESFENVKSDSTTDTDTTEAVNITSSATPIDETTSTTETTTTTISASKWMKTVLIALSCIVVLLILISSYRVYTYRNKFNH